MSQGGVARHRRSRRAVAARARRRPLASSATAEEPAPQEPAVEPVCLNCGAPVDGPFCSQCGQDHAEASRLTLRLTFQDVERRFLKVNRQMGKAAVDLVVRPGMLTADFLAGRRRRHPPPGRLYLVVNFVFFLAAQWFDPVTAEIVAEIVDEVTRTGYYEEVRVASGLASDTFNAVVEERMARSLPTYLVAFVPCIAVILRGLYRRRPLGVVAHTVFGFHLMAFLLLVLMPALLFGTSVNEDVYLVGFYLVLPLWSGLALHHVYGGAWGWTLVRTAALWLGLFFLLGGYIYAISFYALFSAG